MQHKIEANIWKYTIHLITGKRTYMSILGVYLLTLPGATPQSIGLMLLLGNLAGFVFEVPSGYLSDKIGHKNALVLSRACLVLSTGLFLIGSHVSFFILGAVFTNIAIAFKSGTGTAFMHETLRVLGKEGQYSKIMGKVSSIGFAVPIVLIIAIPFLVDISFKAPFAVALAIDIIGLVAVCALVAPQKTKAEIKEISSQGFARVLKEAWSFGVFKYLAFLAIIGGAAIAVSGFKDAYQAFVGVPIIYYGVFWGLSRVIISALLLVNEKIKNWFSFHQFLAIKFLVTSFIVILLGVTTSPHVIVVFFILASSFNWSFKEAQLHYLLDMMKGSNFKATILSLKSLMQNLVIAGGGYALGLAFADIGYQAGFMYAGMVLLITLGVFYVAIVAIGRRRAPVLTQ